MKSKRRCKSEASLSDLESEDERANARIVKQKIFDELKKIIVPQLTLIDDRKPQCPYCCPKQCSNFHNRCPLCLRKTIGVQQQCDLVPYVVKSQPSVRVANSRDSIFSSTEQILKVVPAIEDAKSNRLKNISEALQKLYKAQELLDPVINEIIHCASQLTIQQIQQFRKDNYPICYITAKQFRDTSHVINLFMEVIEDLTSKKTPIPATAASRSLSRFNDVIVNTLYLVNKDDPDGCPGTQKVYVDKFVLKELIQLHEVLGCTIALIQQAEKNNKAQEAAGSDSSDSNEYKRSLREASKASLSKKKKFQSSKREIKPKKSKSCVKVNRPQKVGADRECRGIKSKGKYSQTDYKECVPSSSCCLSAKKKCEKPRKVDKECEKRKPSCKKEKTKQESTKKAKINFDETKGTILLDIKIDGRPIQIKMDKDTKSYLVKSIQKSKPLNITANESPVDDQKSSNIINSVMLGSQNNCEKVKASSLTVGCCNCDYEKADLSDQGNAPPIESTEYLEPIESKDEKAGNPENYEKFGKRSPNTISKEEPFTALSQHEDDNLGSSSISPPTVPAAVQTQTCPCGYAPDSQCYPRCEEESTGTQTLPIKKKNDSRLYSDVNEDLLNKCRFPSNKQTVYQTSGPQSYQNELFSTTYRSPSKASQSTDTQYAELKTFRCVAEKDTELSKLENPSSSNCFVQLKKNDLPQNNLYLKQIRGISDTNSRIYTALSASLEAEEKQSSIHASSICCKCKRKFRKSESGAGTEEFKYQQQDLQHHSSLGSSTHHKNEHQETEELYQHEQYPHNYQQDAESHSSKTQHHRKQSSSINKLSQRDDVQKRKPSNDCSQYLRHQEQSPSHRTSRVSGASQYRDKSYDGKTSFSHKGSQQQKSLTKLHTQGHQHEESVLSRQEHHDGPEHYLGEEHGTKGEHYLGHEHHHLHEQHEEEHNLKEENHLGPEQHNLNEHQHREEQSIKGEHHLEQEHHPLDKHQHRQEHLEQEHQHGQEHLGEYHHKDSSHQQEDPMPQGSFHGSINKTTSQTSKAKEKYSDSRNRSTLCSKNLDRWCRRSQTTTQRSDPSKSNYDKRSSILSNILSTKKHEETSAPPHDHHEIGYNIEEEHHLGSEHHHGEEYHQEVEHHPGEHHHEVEHYPGGHHSEVVHHPEVEHPPEGYHHEVEHQPEGEHHPGIEHNHEDGTHHREKRRSCSQSHDHKSSQCEIIIGQNCCKCTEIQHTSNYNSNELVPKYICCCKPHFPGQSQETQTHGAKNPRKNSIEPEKERISRNFDIQTGTPSNVFRTDSQTRHENDIIDIEPASSFTDTESSARSRTHKRGSRSHKSAECKCKCDEKGVQVHPTDPGGSLNARHEASEDQFQQRLFEESNSDMGHGHHIKDNTSNKMSISETTVKRRKDLMIIKIVVPEAAAAAIEGSLRSPVQGQTESNTSLPVAVEIISSYSTNVKVIKSEANLSSTRIAHEHLHDHNGTGSIRSSVYDPLKHHEHVHNRNQPESTPLRQHQHEYGSLGQIEHHHEYQHSLDPSNQPEYHYHHSTDEPLKEDNPFSLLNSNPNQHPGTSSDVYRISSGCNRVKYSNELETHASPCKSLCRSKQNLYSNLEERKSSLRRNTTSRYNPCDLNSNAAATMVRSIRNISCPSLTRDDRNQYTPSLDITRNTRKKCRCENASWKETVLEAIYRLLFGSEGTRRDEECEIELRDTTTTIKFSQEAQCPSTHAFRNYPLRDSITYTCNLVSPNIKDIAAMKKTIDKDLINKLGDILSVKSSKLSKKGNKLDLSLVLSFQTFKTQTETLTMKETVSCTAENRNIPEYSEYPSYKPPAVEKAYLAVPYLNKQFSKQVSSTSFLKNALKKHSCRSILINPLVENSLQNDEVSAQNQYTKQIIT